MGWLVFAGIVLAAALLLWRSGFPRRLWTIPATALMLGAAGYAWQGSPGLAGQPVAAARKAGEIDPSLVALRDAMFGRFNLEFAYFTAADAMTRAGSPRQAANVMIGAVRKAPRSAALWTGLGLALAENDGMQVSPAAKFAFDRALQLGPEHPGPRFFYGLALIREEKFAEARPYWAKAVELAPANASYRDELLVRLFLLDRLLEAKAAQERAPAPARP
ncbi:tetratricopeptide repeat protein [Sphingomonas sp. DT-207]|uniref:tetratricopeptide repeat protein n=1 Tax=Sphingomonas sp. DT-207 TaxID=3396167 RepID=UPI003F1AE3A4